MRLIAYPGLLLVLLFPTFAGAQTSLDAVEEDFLLDSAELEMAIIFEAYLDSIERTITFYSDTSILIGGDMATLTIPKDYMYVGPADSRKVLEEMWGNPPSAINSLGMLFPKEHGPSSEFGYGIDIYFADEGYVEDDDAADIDYDDLLESMKEDAQAENEMRLQEGYDPIHLIGWANPPYYDSQNKRLHWAKELNFGGMDENTLNYNVLFLGRKGYLTMNVIGSMQDVDAVTEDLPQILQSVEYSVGHRYEDFDPEYDKVAAYGIGALVAGKVLAKTGLLATIGIFLAKAWKIILIGFVALGAGAKKLMGK